MLSVLLDVRRARQRRLTLVALSGCALLLPFLAPHVPGLAPGATGLGAVSLGAAALLASSAAAAWAGREAHWTVADDVAWSVSLAALATLSGVGRDAVSVATLLYGLAAVSLAVRVPPTRLVGVTGLTAVLAVLARVASGARGASLTSGAIATVLILVAHVTLARATHALAYVLAEREALLAERRAPPRRERDKEHSKERKPRSEREAEAPAGILESPRWRTAADARSDDARPSDEPGWDGLVERLRSAVTTLCEPVGVAATVHAETRGLAPPTSRMRQNVLKIAQEAAHHALRDTAPRSIAITLKRGDGGLLLEVLDDGAMGESLRSRRALAALRGRVAQLGGSAELRRADAGWVVRVRLPCEQLN